MNNDELLSKYGGSAAPTPRTENDTVSFDVIVGALLRGQFRRELLSSALVSRGVTFTEDKGWLDSLFVINGPRWVMREIYNWVKEIENS